MGTPVCEQAEVAVTLAWSAEDLGPEVRSRPAASSQSLATHGSFLRSAHVRRPRVPAIWGTDPGPDPVFSLGPPSDTPADAQVPR